MLFVSSGDTVSVIAAQKAAVCEPASLSSEPLSDHPEPCCAPNPIFL